MTTTLSALPFAPVHHLHQIELANRWRISPRTLERWRWLHQGPAFMKIGGRVVYRLADIEAFEVAQRRDSAMATNPNAPAGR
jgi:Helix-turn-helix domain